MSAYYSDVAAKFKANRASILPQPGPAKIAAVEPSTNNSPFLTSESSGKDTLSLLVKLVHATTTPEQRQTILGEQDVMNWNKVAGLSLPAGLDLGITTETELGTAQETSLKPLATTEVGVSTGQARFGAPATLTGHVSDRRETTTAEVSARLSNASDMEEESKQSEPKRHDGIPQTTEASDESVSSVSDVSIGIHKVPGPEGTTLATHVDMGGKTGSVMVSSNHSSIASDNSTRPPEATLTAPAASLASEDATAEVALPGDNPTRPLAPEVNLTAPAASLASEDATAEVALPGDNDTETSLQSATAITETADTNVNLETDLVPAVDTNAVDDTIGDTAMDTASAPARAVDTNATDVAMVVAVDEAAVNADLAPRDDDAIVDASHDPMVESDDPMVDNAVNAAAAVLPPPPVEEEDAVLPPPPVEAGTVVLPLPPVLPPVAAALLAETTRPVVELQVYMEGDGVYTRTTKELPLQFGPSRSEALGSKYTFYEKPGFKKNQRDRESYSPTIGLFPPGRTCYNDQRTDYTLGMAPVARKTNGVNKRKIGMLEEDDDVMNAVQLFVDSDIDAKEVVALLSNEKKKRRRST